MPAFADPSQQMPTEQALIHPSSGPTFDLGPPVRVGVMASGNGSNFEALVSAIWNRRIHAEIALLVVNNPGCGAQRGHGRAADSSLLPSAQAQLAEGPLARQLWTSSEHRVYPSGYAAELSL